MFGQVSLECFHESKLNGVVFHKLTDVNRIPRIGKGFCV